MKGWGSPVTSQHFTEQVFTSVNNQVAHKRNGSRPLPTFATDCQVTGPLFLFQARLGESMKLTDFWLWAVVVALSYYVQGKAEGGL